MIPSQGGRHFLEVMGERGDLIIKDFKIARLLSLDMTRSQHLRVSSRLEHDLEGISGIG